MASHSSASVREQAPHVNQTARTATITNALKHRAQSVLNDRSIDPQSRAIIRYALEINDPWLAELVKRADAGEAIFEAIDFLGTPETLVGEENIAALTEMICQASDQSSAALLVLMSTLENSPHPKALANHAKHLAFTCRGESNLNGMVDAQVALLENELLPNRTD